MGQGSRIKKKQLNLDTGRISKTPVSEDQVISFNFKHLKEGNKKFLYQNRESQYFLKFIERVKALSCMTRRDLVTNKSTSLRCHTIKFLQDSRLTEDSYGIGQEADDDAWQFEISKSEHGRVHGFFVANVFYVVWLDPKHELYS